MDLKFKVRFLSLWKKYFNNAELPLVFYYTDKENKSDLVKPESVPRCIIAALSLARKGKVMCFNAESIGCFGGRRYFGFAEKIMDDFEAFLSCGIPGTMEGERYKKTPRLVAELLKATPPLKAPSPFVVFKRWDLLEEADMPDVAIFFASPDVLAGLFTLANFDETEMNAVFTPFGSGCASIAQYPYLEKASMRPRAVIGLFDVSARPFVPGNTLTFSAPMNKFGRMVENMEESFLTTNSWKAVQKRLP